MFHFFLLIIVELSNQTPPCGTLEMSCNVLKDDDQAVVQSEKIPRSSCRMRFNPRYSQILEMLKTLPLKQIHIVDGAGDIGGVGGGGEA